MLCWLADSPKAITQLKTSQPRVGTNGSNFEIAIGLLTNNFSTLLDYPINLQA